MRHFLCAINDVNSGLSVVQDIEDKHVLRILMEGTVEELWQQFQHEQQKYTKATVDRQIAFDLLRATDQRNAQKADLQMRHMQKLQVRKKNTSLHKVTLGNAVNISTSSVFLKIRLHNCFLLLMIFFCALAGYYQCSAFSAELQSKRE